MPQIRTADGRVLLADQGDGNAVVYYDGRAVWDRWSFEAGAAGAAGGSPNPLPPASAPVPVPMPIVGPPSPAPPLQRSGRVIRVTDARDGTIRPRMYADLANAFVNPALNAAFLFCGTDEGPRFFKVDLGTERVDRLGPLVAYGGETEGWSWDRLGRVLLCEGPRFRRVNPFNPDDDQVLCDITDAHPGCDLWQPHSSDDGQTHSATVRRIVSEGSYPKLGTLVLRHGRQEYFPAHGTLDESQVTRDGRFLIIKENTGDGDDNRIINLETRETQLVKDRDRAVGHSDCGDSVVIGEADKPDPGACVLFDLRQPVNAQRARILFTTTNMGYLSYRAGVCLHSGAESLSLVDLTGAGLTPIARHGNAGSDYDDRVKANLSPCARVACFMSNRDGRRDVYLLVL